jgi:hypothetical protein
MPEIGMSTATAFETKMILQNGTGRPIQYGDHVKVEYSGAWSGSEKEANGIQYVTWRKMS